MKPFRPLLYALLAAAFLVFGMLIASAVHQEAWADGYADAGPAAPAGTVDAGVAMNTPSDPAPAPSALPDPVANPSGFMSALSKLWRGGTIPAAIIVMVFGILAWLRAKVGWFAKGRQAVYIASALAMLGMLAEGVASGGTPNLGMILSALITGLALYIKSEHPPSAGV